MDSSFVTFNVEALRGLLAGTSCGADLRFVPELPSTNELAAEIPPGEWRHGTAIFTDHQTSGRGRRGRSWSAPPGSSVLVSVVLEARPELRPSHVVFVASLAVADALQQVAGLRTAIKWPNDVHIEGRKLAGILIENYSDRDGRIVVGMGLNANVAAVDLPALNPAAGSVLVETGRPVSREALAAALLQSLKVWYRCLTREPDDVFSAWKSRLDTLRSPVDVHDSRGTWSGVAIDVQADGGLIVERDGGERQVVHAADVSIRRRNGLQEP